MRCYRCRRSLFEQSERNIGAVVEHFKDQVSTLVEGVFMQIEKVERLSLANDRDHENYEARLSRLELWCKRWKKA